jgi:hypothetical protein
MAHYAFLDDSNTVTEVIVGIDETELIEGKTPEDWYTEFRGQKCVRTSYNGKIRCNYAGIGYTYDPIDDAFIAPAPCEHDSLALTDKKKWECSTCDELTKIV